MKHIKGGWDNVQSLFIKTNSSAALPIWQCDLGTEAGGRWEGLVASAEDEVMKDAEDDEMDVERAPITRSQGKKRTAEEAEKDDEKPKKRTKAAVKPSETKPAPPAVATAPLSAAKGKGKAVEASPAPAADPAPATSEPAKKKRRKSAVEPAPSVPAAVTDESPDTPGDKKRKRRKSQVRFPDCFVVVTVLSNSFPGRRCCTGHCRTHTFYLSACDLC